MEFVTIGNPGNAADTTGKPNPVGSVGYEYGIGKFEVSRGMITKYNSAFGTANSLDISLADMTRFVGGNGANKPATGVSWNEAARFVNWLNTSTGNMAAYKFTTNGVNDNIALWSPGDAGYDSSNRYRNSLAKYVLPSYNELYKAAYYDPNKNGGAGGYWDFQIGSDIAPVAVASGTSAGTAVYQSQNFWLGPADVDQAGGLSPYGVMGLGGNVVELEESSHDVSSGNYNSSSSSWRGLRGGYWAVPPIDLSSLIRSPVQPEMEYFGIGFRVVSLDPSSGPPGPPSVVPEPSMIVIGTLFGLGGLIARRRTKK
jgi:formylglycine-generating enzyme required for sulfatase activity